MNASSEKGFSEEWITWVHACLSSTKLSYIINGKKGLHFKVHKGLKQGSPFSPLLFIIVVDVFNAIIHRVMERRFLDVMSDRARSWLVPNLHFVDNTTVIQR